MQAAAREVSQSHSETKRLRSRDFKRSDILFLRASILGLSNTVVHPHSLSPVTTVTTARQLLNLIIPPVALPTKHYVLVVFCSSRP